MHGSVCNQVMDGALFASAVQIHVSGILSGRHKDTKLSKHTQISLCICTFLTEPSLNSVYFQCARDKSSIARKPEVQSKMFKWLITFQKCNPPDFNFHPNKLTDKIFTIWSNINFLHCFILLNAVKTDTKLTLDHMGGNFYH